MVQILRSTRYQSTFTSCGKCVELFVQITSVRLSYNALNTAWSALSTFLKIQTEPIGRHPFVIRFLKGCYQLRPSIPKNIVTRDVNIVLRYLDGLFPLDKITFRNLTLKCVTLLAILSAPKAISLHSIDVRNITLFEKEVKIRFGDLLKTSRPGVHQAEIAIAAFHRSTLFGSHSRYLLELYQKKWENTIHNCSSVSYHRIVR